MRWVCQGHGERPACLRGARTSTAAELLPPRSLLAATAAQRRPHIAPMRRVHGERTRSPPTRRKQSRHGHLRLPSRSVRGACRPGRLRTSRPLHGTGHRRRPIGPWRPPRSTIDAKCPLIGPDRPAQARAGRALRLLNVARVSSSQPRIEALMRSGRAALDSSATAARRPRENSGAEQHRPANLDAQPHPELVHRRQHAVESARPGWS